MCVCVWESVYAPQPAKNISLSTSLLSSLSLPHQSPHYFRESQLHRVAKKEMENCFLIKGAKKVYCKKQLEKKKEKKLIRFEKDKALVVEKYFEKIK